MAIITFLYVLLIACMFGFFHTEGGLKIFFFWAEMFFFALQIILLWKIKKLAKGRRKQGKRPGVV